MLSILPGFGTLCSEDSVIEVSFQAVILAIGQYTPRKIGRAQTMHREVVRKKAMNVTLNILRLLGVHKKVPILKFFESTIDTSKNYIYIFYVHSVVTQTGKAQF